MVKPSRTILVDIDVFAAIWADRRPGENSENDILRRKFAAKPDQPIAASPARIVFRDLRSGTEFPEGFEIFRGYKGQEYRASAVEGGWLLIGTSDVYESLNQLSRAIGTGPENAWMGWHYRDPNTGRRRVLDDYRKRQA